MTFPCTRLADNSSLVLAEVLVDGKYKPVLAFDTGAPHSTIDSNALFLYGCNAADTIATAMIETANGMAEAEVFRLHTFASLGIVKEGFEVQVYDFRSHGIFSD